MENNHLQGYCNSTIHYGAYYNDNLIAVMSFKKTLKNGYDWELTRFASDITVTCRGVGSKLFKHFVKQHNPKSVKSFADRRWTTLIHDNFYNNPSKELGVIGVTGTNGKTTVSYNGVTQLTIHTEDGITYHTAYENGIALVKVGSDHSVTWLKEIKDVISPAPVTSQLDGVRVKLNYDKYHDLIENVIVDGKKLSELAEIKKSFMYDYILVKINSESSLVEDSN